jgi:hypothetical protein
MDENLVWFVMDAPKEKTIARTYRLPIVLVGKLNSEAAALRVWPSSLVAYLLERALDEVEAGRWEVPTEPSHQNIIQER